MFGTTRCVCAFVTGLPPAAGPDSRIQGRFQRRQAGQCQPNFGKCKYTPSLWAFPGLSEPVPMPPGLGSPSSHFQDGTLHHTECTKLQTTQSEPTLPDLLFICYGVGGIEGEKERPFRRKPRRPMTSRTSSGTDSKCSKPSLPSNSWRDFISLITSNFEPRQPWRSTGEGKGGRGRR